MHVPDILCSCRAASSLATVSITAYSDRFSATDEDGLTAMSSLRTISNPALRVRSATTSVIISSLPATSASKIVALLVHWIMVAFCDPAWKNGSDSLLMKLRRGCGLVQGGIRAMQSFHASQLLPPGFCAVEALNDVDNTVITIRARNRSSACPSFGVVWGRINSRDPRRWADSPIAGRRSPRPHFILTSTSMARGEN
jgi:hypothetical protein